MNAASSLAGVRVLVVDDHEDSRDAVRQILESLGATVWQAGTGVQALALATREPPDLVLCDLRTPGMDGFALLERFRSLETRHPIPVLAVTGLAREWELERTRAAGFDGHLVKPIDYDRLVAAVEGVLGRA